MSGGEVVCSGWLRKSPPEKKLKRYVSALALLLFSSLVSLPFSPLPRVPPRPARPSSPRPSRPGPAPFARSRSPPGSPRPPPSLPPLPFPFFFFFLNSFLLSPSKRRAVSSALPRLYRLSQQSGERGGVFPPSPGLRARDISGFLPLNAAAPAPGGPPRRGCPGSAPRRAGGAFALGTGALQEEGAAGKVPFPRVSPSCPPVLRRKYFSGAEPELAGKWSVFAERADFVTGQRPGCCCCSGLAATLLSSHVGGRGDARSQLCSALSHWHWRSLMVSV